MPTPSKYLSRSAARLLGVAYEFIGFMVAPPLLGYYLATSVFPEYTGGNPDLFVIIGLGLGFSGGFWHLYRRLASMPADEPETGAVESSIKEETVTKRIENISAGFEDLDRRMGRIGRDGSEPGSGARER